MYRYTQDALEQSAYRPDVLSFPLKTAAAFYAQDVGVSALGVEDPAGKARRVARTKLVGNRAILREGAKLVDKREMLRIKLKSLMEEARIIRREEQRTWGAFREELRNHRVLTVRRAARNAHIAYGLIRGLSVEDMEQDAYWRTLPEKYPGQFSALAPDWMDVGRMISRYGAAGDREAFAAMFEPGSQYTVLKPGPEHRIKERPTRPVEREERSFTPPQPMPPANPEKLNPASAWPFPLHMPCVK